MDLSSLSFSRKYNFAKIVLISGFILVFLLCSAFVVGRVYIKHEAKNVAKEASAVFHKDNTDSLLMMIESDNYSLKEKNMAVWALGILKDEKALTKLEILYTGEKCNHSEDLCQYELKKAILKIKGDFRGSWQVSR